MVSKDTIFAVATPPGRSAIAVIRISGSLAKQAPTFFGTICPKAGQFKYARLMIGGQVVDEVLILFMQGPRSSTGENVCELHCHGSSAVVSIVLAKLAEMRGFRPAEPGEFTRRAFMHDKLDIFGVEGLADVVDAETSKQLHQAWAQIDGCLRGPVALWREELIILASQLEALIDFADEDLPKNVELTFRQQAALLIKDIANTLDDQRTGELIRDGVVVALVGPVNAGKSTILNGLSGRAAAIVSDEAGTTRDIISVRLDINGVPTTILDTAGIRDAAGVIEAEGIRRTVEAAQHADVVVFVVDISSGNWSKDIEFLGGCIDHPNLIVLNKADKVDTAEVPADAMLISAHNDRDVVRLLARIGEIVIPNNQAQSSAVITRVRHREALQKACDSLRAGLQHNFHITPELAAEDFRQAVVALGRITGEIDIEELLDQIFLRFCIGK
ncbi:MAG: tRNA uridine-5-carboxymethylaminomethyl(34) synthesis GTPase MnmE [Candidatus Puniceispirillaceae bacterium]